MIQHKVLPDKGAIIGISIITLWFVSLSIALNFIQVSWENPLAYIFVLLQTHLYTGLFITAHDAMHGVASKNKKINNFLGWISAGLFAFNYYKRLFPRHHNHHRFVATEKDPDYSTGNFFSWYFSFVREYVTLWQIILMALSYEGLKLIFPAQNALLFFVIPSLLATLQLFYFGTYVPHKGNPGNKHHAETQRKNHFWAFISCYFFGYHYEHHNRPNVPWWSLYKEKERLVHQGVVS